MTNKPNQAGKKRPSKKNTASSKQGTNKKPTRAKNGTSKKSGRKPRVASKAAPPTSNKIFTRGFLLRLLVVIIVIGGGVLLYFDALIQHKFEGKRWAVPAKVYARPLEIFDGIELTVQQLRKELERLNYQHTNGPLKTGEYHQSNSEFEIATRRFAFWDGLEKPHQVSLSIRRGQVVGLRVDQQQDAILRLEPTLAGGIYPAHNEDRILVALNQVPQQLVEGLVAVEDRDFYSHWGVSPKGIIRAMLTNIKSGAVRQGGSTLTQQLVKNFYLSSERTLSRKATEAIMSLLLEFHYEKDEILEAYLNEVYLGQSGQRAIHGFGLASTFYFGIPVQELSLHQVALLVGLVKGPSWYDPRRQPERAMERRNQVLSLMAEQGFITNLEKQRASQQSLGVIKKPRYDTNNYPAFIDLVKRQLHQDYRDEDLRSEGLRIFTTLDPDVQESLENSFRKSLNNIEQRFGKTVGKLEGAGVFTDSNTGEVLAVVGGRNPRYKGFNRALDAYRPVGSLMKPAVYLAALEKGYTLASMLDDDDVEIELPNGDVWQPQNFDNKSHGQIPLRTALSHSYNQATARLAMDVGVGAIVDVTHRLGVDKKLPAVPSLSLGAVSLSPLEVANMYQTFAGDGFNIPLRTIRSVLDGQGQPLQRYAIEVEKRFDSGDVFVLNNALQDAVRQGTGKSAYWVLPKSLEVAGKTGTSDDQRDSWFAGFSGNYLGVVWLGYDDNDPTPLTGASGALKVWANTLATLPAKSLDVGQPANVEWVWVDPARNALSQSHCDGSIFVPMVAETIPSGNVGCATSGRVMNWFNRWLK